MKIGIYGGTFNPPHAGHLAAARAAAAVLELDKLVFVPAGIPPHKELPADTPGDGHRLEMVRILADQLRSPERTEVWDVELSRPGKSYTADTLRAAAERWPGAELWLLVGTDMFLTLQTWYHPEEVMGLAGICAFGRTESDSEELFAPQRDYLTKTYNARVVTLSIPDLVDISSTRLREELSGGGGGEYLPQPVYGYILREKLYGTFSNLTRLTNEQLRCVSYSMVKAKRIPHIKGTEEEAVRLALRWGADVEKMRRAAILHDCTKYLTLSQHLDICARYGVELDEMERSTEKLLHSKTGALLAKYLFGEDEEIYDSIFYHTTARGDMSLGGKIIYMADYIEPNRNFDGVEEMRALAYSDLDAAVGMGARMAIEEMKEKGRIVHHNTQEAYDQYWGKE